jgi:pilus assembly protein Flp/PilA
MFDNVKNLLALVADRRGVTALEYAMIAGVIVATIAVGFGILASNLNTQFSTLGTSL